MKTFLTYSLGCRVNQAEIEEITNDLVAMGFTPWSKSLKSPNLILINTCVVTQKAERETRQIIRRIRRTYPNAFLVVLGCGINAHQKLKIALPETNLLVSNEEKRRTAKLIFQRLGYTPSKPLTTYQFDQLDQTCLPAGRFDKYSSSDRKLLKIQDGCNQFCTFCIVPYLRGKPRSKKPEEIIKSCQTVSLSSCQEVVLTGINLSLYGKDLKPQTTLIELLKKILKETKIPRISLSSLTPEVITKDLVNLYLDDWKNGKGRLSRYWHLAIQSGSPKILEKMGRKTNLENLKKSLYLISARGGSAFGGKAKIPEFVFRADFLVGFPGETEKDFQLTLQLIKVAKISFSHVFPFSKRPRTAAFKMIEKGIWKDLPAQVKKDRVRQVTAETRKVRYTEARKLVGKILPCLFLDKKENCWQTLADNSWPVRIFLKTIQPFNHLVMSEDLKGKILQVKINKAKANYLLGNILSLPT